MYIVICFHNSSNKSTIDNIKSTLLLGRTFQVLGFLSYMKKSTFHPLNGPITVIHKMRSNTICEVNHLLLEEIRLRTGAPSRLTIAGSNINAKFLHGKYISNFNLPTSTLKSSKVIEHSRRY